MEDIKNQIQDGQDSANSVIEHVKVKLENLKGEIAKSTFKEELMTQLEELFDNN
jgi:hypothetical protein